MRGFMDAHILSALADWVVYALGAVLTWWVKIVWSSVNKQQTALSELHIKMATDYVTKQELNKSLDRIFDAIDDIRKGMSK